MKGNCTYLPYSKTNYFSELVIDYLDNNIKLSSFYKHKVNLKGIEDAIRQRRTFSQERNVLVDELWSQYKGLNISTSVVNNLKLLSVENTFTVTTAHQPNIFTGPLYFIYKILHTVKLSSFLKQQLPDFNFVPVYYMGSEDADLDELGQISIDGAIYKWNTDQTGAVGRMKVDNSFLQLIAQMHGQLGVLKYGNELIETFQNIYTKGKTIQQATLELVNHLFGDYGLIVLIPDNAALKKLFAPVIKKELSEEFSNKAVTASIELLRKNYKVQAGGRELNLFYLKDNKRERIEKEGDLYKVKSLSLTFTQQEIFDQVDQYPERFSPNVILRGVFQETILPNIAFIGGGGELAYWLELKKVFEEADVPYPMLILRNSFMIVEENWSAKIKEIGLSVENIFQPHHDLMKLVIANKSNTRFQLNGELHNTEMLYDKIALIASGVDKTLNQHVAALKTKALKNLHELEKKMIRAEKRKFEVEQRQIQKIKQVLFPGNNLQERAENFSMHYGKLGKQFLDIILEYSNALEQQFAIVEIVN